VNPILSTLDLGTHLNGVLPHASVCVIRCKPHQGHEEEEEDTPLYKKEEEERREKKKEEEGRAKKRRGKGGGRSLHQGEAGASRPPMAGTSSWR
jgi:hypothetical protein